MYEDRNVYSGIIRITLQCLVMGIGFLAIIIQGSNIVGGIDKVFEIAGKHGRIDFFQ